jgi:hypothetical protein
MSLYKQADPGMFRPYANLKHCPKIQSEEYGFSVSVQWPFGKISSTVW